jgi:Yip1-like protein
VTFVDRMIGAARLDPRAYEEVEADEKATLQALAVVALSAVANGIGRGEEVLAIGFAVQALFMWVIWAGLSYAVGVYLIPEPQTNANLGQMLRTIGFAASPGILRFFRFIPFLGPLLSFVVGIWVVAAMIVAIRQALDYKSLGRAAVVCLIAWFVAMLMGIVFGAMLLISAGSLFF